MKRKLLFLVPLISTSMILTACGGLEGGGEGGGGGNGITLPNTAEEAVNMFYQFATTNGVEISYRIYDDESNAPESYTIGFKSDVFWVKEDVAYKKVDSTLEMYEYDADKRSYEFQVAVTETAEMSLDAILKNFTAAFYAGYEYASGSDFGSFTSKKDVTFLTRPATEYTFSYAAMGAQASLNIVFDNATGITLKIYGSASSGSDSSSAEFEVTSFAIGAAVTVPTLNKSSGQGGEGQGGEGGEGGQTDVDYFGNKLLMYTSNKNYNVFNGSQLGLFSDGKFELSFTQNGYRVVFFGEYTVDASKASATLVTSKVYKDQTKQYTKENQTWKLNYSDGAYTLVVSSNGEVYYNASAVAPTHADVPSEGGEDGQTSGLVGHLFTYVSQQNAAGFVNSTLALFDDGTFEIVTSENGKLVVYLGTYTVNASETTANLSVSRVYKEQSNSYSDGVGSWIFTVQANNQFYLAMPGATVIYVMSSNSPVHADIPEDSGQGDDPEDDKYKITADEYNDMIMDGGLIGLESNFSAVVTTSDNRIGYSSYEFDNGKIRCFSVDADGATNEYFAEYTVLDRGEQYYKNDEGVWVKQAYTYGIGSYMNGLGILYIEFSDFTFNSTTKQYELDSWTNGFDAYSDIYLIFEEGVLLEMGYKGQYAERKVVFSNYGKVSVTLPEIGSGGEGGQGQQEDSKWPAQDIAAKLSRLGLDVTIPAPNVEDENIVSVTDELSADNASLLITITLDDVNYAAVVFSSLIDSIDGFTLDYSNSDIENGVYALLNEAKDTIIVMTYSRDSAVVTLRISEFKGNPYPTDKIAAFITANELTTALPSLAMDNVSYTFHSEDGFASLTMEPMGDNTAENIISNAEAILVRGNFKVFYAPAFSDEGGLSALYIDPAVQYFVSFVAQEDGSVYAYISLGGEEMAAAVDFTYPQDKITAFVPEEVEDTLPSFAVSGAIYSIGEDGNGFQLQIHMQSGMSAERIISDFSTRFTRAGYTLDAEGDGGYHSANNQIVIYLDNVGDKIVQIQVRFIEEEEPPIEEPIAVTYTLICDNDWDIFVDEAQVYVYAWKENGDFEWIELEKNEEGVLSIELDNTFIGMKVVRFDKNSEIGWKYGGDGSVNENVTIHNETDDIKLSGEDGEIHFFLKG